MDFEAWEPSDADELAPAVIHQIVCDIEDGNPNPDQARRLLHHFATCVEGAHPLPQPLLKYLTHAITEYLNAPKDGELERLLGLRLPRKRPTSTTDRNHQIAWDVLVLRLGGKTLEIASAELADKYHIGDNKIRDIWGEHKATALDLERLSRVHESPDSKAHWNDDEVRQLVKIYGEAIRTP